MLRDIKEIFSSIGITLEPRGIWHYPNGYYAKKEAKDMRGRREGSTWSQFPNDNMSGFFLRPNHQLIIIDVDGCPLHNLEDHDYLPSIDLVLPTTLTTVTSNENKRHYYYKVTKAQQTKLRNRTVNLAPNLDIFTYASIFEGHPSELQQVLDHPVASLTKEMLDVITAHQDVVPYNGGQGIEVSSNPQRTNYARSYLADELNVKNTKQMNQFYRTLLGKPNNLPSGNAPKVIKPKKNYTFNYNLINDLVVRLSSTAELDWDEHVVPVVYKLIEEFGIDPLSAKSQAILQRQIFRTVPHHDAITKDSVLEELDLDNLKALQPDTAYPFVVKVPHDGKVFFLDIDRNSLQPLSHGNRQLMSLDLVKTLHPERMMYNEAGQPIGWDDHTIPLFYSIDDPYKQQYYLDHETYRHTINLHIKTEYELQAAPSSVVPVNNVVYKLMQSVVHPDYLDYMLYWHAHTVFGSTQLNMIPWIATPKSAMGGTGKTQATGLILTKLIGTAIVKMDFPTFMKTWADMGAGIRAASFQDFPANNNKTFEEFHFKTKQQTDAMFSKLDSKHGAISTGKQIYQINGSSNDRPPLPESDRRFLCLEPAHLDGDTEPLTYDEAARIDAMPKDMTDTHYPEYQEYMNYLLYLFNKPLSAEMRKALFRETPATKYRSKWIKGALKNGEALIISMYSATDLYNISKIPPEKFNEYVSLLSYIVEQYHHKKGTVGLSYKWFIAMFPFILSNKYSHEEDIKSVSDVEKIIGRDFTKNIGKVYIDSMRNSTTMPGEFRKWPAQGLLVSLAPETIQGYNELIAQLIDNNPNKLSIANTDTVTARSNINIEGV